MKLHRSIALGCLLSACIFGGNRLSAQASSPEVQYNATTKVFRLDSKTTSYVLGVNDHGELQTMYWGGKLSAKDTFMQAKIEEGIASFDPPTNLTPREYIGWGGVTYVEPDLKITFPDGNRDLVLHYVSYSADHNDLAIRMKDISREIYVTLHYSMDPETGILARHASIENKTGQPIRIEQVAAATWNLPAGTDYRLRYLSGRWAAEWTVNEKPIGPGKTILESRRGTTGAQNNPWFAIDHAGTGSNAETGSVWFGALGWSGSWQISVEQDQAQQVRVTGGPNAFDFAYLLQEGKTFETPVFYGGFSEEGMGGASRLLHRYETDFLLPHHPQEKIRPVLYNSWEATEFSVDEAGQELLAEKAARLGVERFVMDDGWFGARNSDRAGLGDWVPNPKKFPHGLTPLIEKVHALGMDFGLWVEPEMVNPDSDLYRAHPDWVLNFTGRPETPGRHQLVLNLARPDVHDYLLKSLDTLLSENDIAFLKWDYNRNWSEPGWPAVPVEQQKNVYVDFTKNYYDILAELRKRHPKVEIESCSGGGGRVDLGVLRYTDEVWTSDNTDAYDRLKIQNGFTYAYTPAVMMSWVTDSPTWVNQRTLSATYRFLSSMQGSLGIGADLNKWSSEDMETAKEMVAIYKQIRETVQRGSLYRLMEPTHGSEQSVTESVARDGHEAVVFAFLHSSHEGYPYPRVQLKGLEPEALYKVEIFAGAVAKNTPEVASGSYWQQIGVDFKLIGDFQAAGIKLSKVSH